jgi:hypothetical protein
LLYYFPETSGILLPHPPKKIRGTFLSSHPPEIKVAAGWL